MSFVTYYFFFFNDTATTEIYTLSLHDALPIYQLGMEGSCRRPRRRARCRNRSRSASRSPRPRPRLDRRAGERPRARGRSEEHTSELQSRQYLVCRLLLEKKKQKSVHTTSEADD